MGSHSLLGLDGLFSPRNGRSKRSSSWDTTGGNRDYRKVGAGERCTLAEVASAGIIRHIWITVGHPDKNYLRTMVLRAYWDGENTPSIECPLGDFFCLGHGIARSFQNAAFNAVTDSSNEGALGGGVALNCYLPMPFEHGMRIEIENQSALDCSNLYFYVDYDEVETVGDALRLHAQYRQECPTVVEGGPLANKGENYWSKMDVSNASSEGNYVILEATGRGQYIGCNLSVENLDPMLGKREFNGELLDSPELTWWGEGDDMIFIDDDTWPPSLHGTGSEDYLTQAWGMHDHAFLFGGTSVHEYDPRFKDRRACTSYRLHIPDPVLFSKRIRVTIEHGHANLQQNDYSSVAYWYQDRPFAGHPPLPPAEERVARFAKRA